MKITEQDKTFMREAIRTFVAWKEKADKVEY